MQRDDQAAVDLDASDIARVVAALAGGDFFGYLMETDGSFEECVDCGLIALGLQHKNNGVASIANGPIKVLPPTRDFDVSFVHPPARAD